MRFLLLCGLLVSAVVAAAADSEDFRVEVTATGWRAGIDGDLQAGPLPVDLRRDLDLRERWQFFGKLVLKPGRRHRIVVEGTPYRFEGESVLARTITFGGRTYRIEEPVASEATMTYVYGGYQFDFISRRLGHLGLNAGGAYLEAAGEVRSQLLPVVGRHEERIGVPLAGIAGRVFLVPNRVSLSGDVKGMHLGRYGHYLQGGIEAGVGIGPVLFIGGWRIVDADVHEEDGGSGIRPRIAGPVVGIQLRH